MTSQPETEGPQDTRTSIATRVSRRRKGRWVLVSIVIVIAGLLGIFAGLGWQPFSGSTQLLLPYAGSRQLMPSVRSAVSSCQAAFTHYRQSDRNSTSSGRATSVLAAYASTVGSLDTWKGVSPGTFGNSPDSKRFYVCYLAGTWVQNPDQLMGTPTFHESIYVIAAPWSPLGPPRDHYRFQSVLGPSLLATIPPPP